jgi:serine/threonine-protein kinase
MLVGEPPYSGATAQAVLGKIIAGEAVSATKHRPAIPANIDAALRKGLEKLSADRFASADEFAKALQDPGFRHGGVSASEATSAPGGWRTLALASTALAFALVAFSVWSAVSAPKERITRYEVALAEGHDFGSDFGVNLAISPDGSSIVYAARAPGEGRPQLWLRRRDQLEPTSIPGSEGAFSPSFSPDGKSIAFLTTNPDLLRTVTLGGGPALTVTDEDLGGGSVHWGADGALYYDGAVSLRRVPATGGESEILSMPDSLTEAWHVYPFLLENERGLIYTATRNPAGDMTKYDVYGLDLETGERKLLVHAVYATYAESGHLVYVTSDGTLLAAPFDADALELTGPGVALTQGVGVDGFGSVDLALAEDGTLVYGVGGVSNGLARAVWVTREGEVTPVDESWEYDPGFPEVAVSLSPDDERLAVMIVTEAGEDIWIKQLDDGPLSRLTFDPQVDRRPRWTPDGRDIVFTSLRAGQFDLWRQPADGTGEATLLLDLPAEILEVQTTEDMDWFLLRLGGMSGVENARDLVGMRAGDTVTIPLAAEPYDEKAAAIAPSGRWFAYESTETGRDEVYVRPFPEVGGGKWQVSTGGGFNPMWANSERELFYVESGWMMVAEIEGDDGSFRVGRRDRLFELAIRNLVADRNYTNWDVDSKDERFLMVQSSLGNEGVAKRMVVVQNFFQELRERVGN